MSWYNPLSWSDKIVDNVLGKDDGLLSQAGGWIDNLSHTDQEKAEDKKELRKGVVAYAIATMDENSERSRARRDIAKMWIKVQLWIILMCCIAAPFDIVLAGFYFKLATSTLMITVSTAICIFFFGSHGLAKYQAGKK